MNAGVVTCIAGHGVWLRFDARRNLDEGRIDVDDEDVGLPGATLDAFRRTVAAGNALVDLSERTVLIEPRSAFAWTFEEVSP